MKYAFVGSGFIAHNHADEVLKMPDVEIVGAVDINEQVGKAFAEKYHTKYYRTPEELFQAEQVDVVDICLPTNLHEEYSIKCAELGADIIMEKPFSLSSASCERIKAGCERSGARLMVAMVLRFWPEYEILRDEILSGRMGSPELVHLHRLVALPRWSAFYDTPSMCGGGVFDMHVHDVDFACYLFGEVEKVYSIGYKNTKDAWNNMVTSLTFKNGVQVSVTSCQEMSDSYPFSFGLRYLGSKGCIEYSSVSGQTLRGEAATSITKYMNGAEPEEMDIPKGNGGYYNEIRYFLDRIKDGKPFETVTVDDGVYCIKVIEAVARSLETGEVVRL